ncbi:hypothetical protein ACFLXT_02790 [Chloroflexota bacterium]
MRNEEFNKVAIASVGLVGAGISFGLLWQWLDSLYNTNLFYFILAVIGIIVTIIGITVLILFLRNNQR